MASIDEFERRLRLLREKLKAGAISPEQFETEVEKLQFRDALGRSWMLGAQSGKWYYHDGQQWIQAEPPRPKVPASPQSKAGQATTRVRPTPRSRDGTPSWAWVGCSGLAVVALILIAILIWAGSTIFLREDEPLVTPTRAAVLPLPHLATATATAAPPVAGEPTATLALANDSAVLLREADDLVLKSQYEEAELRYEKATKLNPAFAVAYARWSRASRLQYPPQLEVALAKAIIATQLDARSAEAFNELAWSYYFLGRGMDAISAAQRAIGVDPNYAGAHAVLAEIFLNSGRAAEGINEATLSVQLDGASPAAHTAMAHALVFTDQMDAALEHFRKAVDLEPNVVSHYVDLGTHLRRMGRFDEAITVYEKAVGLYANLAPAYDGLARAYFSGPADYDKALESFKKAIGIDPQYASAYSGAGFVYLMKGKPDDAVDSFKKALELFPDLQEAKDGLAKAQEAKTQPPTATAVAVVEGATPTKATKPIKKPPAIPDKTPAPGGENASGPAATTAAPAKPEKKESKPAAPPAQPANLTGRIIFPLFHADQADYDIYSRNPDGSGEQFVMGEASQPAASWNGKSVAFRRWKRDSRGVVAMDFAGAGGGGNYHRLTAQSYVEDAMPAWSPDGGTIVFASRRESDRKSRLYVVPSGGGQERALEQNFKPILGITPSWLKDGRIIYSGCAGEACGLIAINGDGGDPKAITNHWTDSSPANSPDGTKIAFMSQREGNWEVFVANVDGTGIVRLTNNRGNDGLPTWSPDGSTIAYASDEGGAWGIWAVGADGSNPHQLFTVNGSMDGRVSGEDDTKSKGWTEERLAWTP